MANIAPLLEVEDLSLYYFLALSVLLVFLVLTILYFFFSRFSTQDRKKAKKELLNLKFEDPKADAYRATKLIKKLSTPQNSEYAKKLIKDLKSHKYKKIVPEVSSSLKNHINEFAKEVDV
ncbi:MAG: hypothetical protein ACLFQJ_09120 [Campylobacterales bacterium]